MNVHMTVKWNTAAACWVADFTDQDKAPLLSGVALVPGADLFGQFEYLAFGGKLIVQTDGDVNAVPTFSNLGQQGKLYFVANPA